MLEPIDHNDPLSILLAREGEEDEVDALEAQRSSGLTRTNVWEPEEREADMHGASPCEIEHASRINRAHNDNPWSFDHFWH